MPIHFQRLGILGGQNLQRGIAFEGPVEIPQIAVDAGDDGVVRQTSADALRDVDGPRAGGDRLDTTVRKGDLNAIHG
jgi:hypothetical protein